MITDEEIKLQGLEALVASLGDVQAEKFICLILRGHFDYTKWQSARVWEEDIETLSRKAMEYRQNS